MSANLSLTPQGNETGYRGTPVFSSTSLVLIAAAHGLVFFLLAAFDIVPVPAPMATLMVHMIQPEMSPPKPVVPPRPQPVERKVHNDPAPVAAPAPTLTTTATAPSNAVAEPPAVRTAAAPPPITPPRFDADYLHNPAPVYPPVSRRMSEEGRVVLKVFVAPAGTPSQVEVSTGSGSPRLDQAALDTVWHWKFVPARRGEETVGGWVYVPITFQLKG